MYKWRKIFNLIKISFVQASINLIKHDGIEHAGYMAFISLLSLFPFLVFFIAFAGFVGQSSLGAYFLQHLGGVLS